MFFLLIFNFPASLITINLSPNYFGSFKDSRLSDACAIINKERYMLKYQKYNQKLHQSIMYIYILQSYFHFPQESLETGWMPSSTPTLLPSHPVLPPTAPLYPPTTNPHKPSPPSGERPLSRQPRQAWRNADSPLLGDNFSKSKPPLPPTSTHQDFQQHKGYHLELSPESKAEGAFDDYRMQQEFGKPPRIPPSPSTMPDTPRSTTWSHKTEKLSEEW